MNTLLSNVNIQQIIIFLSVVEQKGFAKAGLHLHMTQSAVSKSISKLEEELNLTLFTRTTREVSLTNVGELLYRRWKFQLEQMQNAYEEALNIHTQNEKTLNIAIPNTTQQDKYFWPVINLFSKEFPDVHLNIDSNYMSNLYEELVQETYDIIFVPDFEYYSFDDEIVQWMWVASNNIQIAVPNTNPLSQKSILTADDIKNESFLILEDDSSLNYSHFFHDFFEKINVTPKIGKIYKNAYSIKNAYKMGQELTLTDDYFDFGQSKEVKKIPLEGHHNGIICVWNKKMRTPYIEKLIKFFYMEHEKNNRPMI